MSKCPDYAMADPAGWIVGESDPQSSTILFHNLITPRTGMYVVAETIEGCVLGVVEKVQSGNILLGEKTRDVEEIESLTSYPDVRDRIYRYGYIRWISLLEPLVEKGLVQNPSMPVDPMTEIYIAGIEALNKVFRSESKNWIRLGSLTSQREVEFNINVNKLTRHLAILAVTGGGKSNTVCVLSNRIVSGLGGTMVIFDIHGEYAAADKEIAPGKTRVKAPKINPLVLNFSELRRLARIPEKAHNQERILREAWKNLMEKIAEGTEPAVIRGKSFIERLKGEARIAANRTGNKDSLPGVLNRLDDILDLYGDVLDESVPTSLESYIEPGYLNIIDLSSVDEFGADAVVSHYLRRLLDERKRLKITGTGYPVPVLVVIEEAHVLIPREGSTLTKYWAGRIAREGRKFGVGLILVSQRPKNVDQDVLSQTNNKIILRIVEPNDKRYIQAASEQMSEDLLSLLSSLNPGEAIVLGSMTKIPAMVKIDLCPVRTGGVDIDLVEEWSKYKPKTLEEREKEILDELRELY
ncbi:MAG: ATP-binding protein [Desulfurococcales archaeon]|nr:ATP-binding protein [Desulfurococcales archaeon]